MLFPKALTRITYSTVKSSMLPNINKLKHTRLSCRVCYDFQPLPEISTSTSPKKDPTEDTFYMQDSDVMIFSESCKRPSSTGYIQTELMTCCLGRKCQNSVLFQENIQFLYLCFGGYWHNENSEENLVHVNSHIIENIVKEPKAHDLMLPFYSFITIFSKILEFTY